MQCPHKWGKKDIEDFLIKKRIEVTNKENEYIIADEFMEAFVECVKSNEIKNCIVDLREVRLIVAEIIQKKTKN